MVDANLAIVAVVAILAIYVYLRKRPHSVGGGELKAVDWEGYTLSWGQQDKPKLMDVNTEQIYEVVGYKELTAQPLKYEVKVKPYRPVTSTNLGVDIKTITLEEGVNEPVPGNAITCCIHNQPGVWFFSETGRVQPIQPLAKKMVEDRDRKILELQQALNRKESEEDAKVKDKVNMMAKFSGSLPKQTMMPPM